VTVLYILPVRVTGRFVAAASRFLHAVDGYVAAYVALLGGRGDEEALAAAQAQVTTTYAFVEQTLPSVLLENNLILQAESPNSRQAIKLASIEAEVSRLGEAAAAYTPDAADEVDIRTLEWLQSTIHRSIEGVLHPTDVVAVNDTPTAPPTTVLGPDTFDGSPLQLAGGVARYRIQSIVRQIEDDFNANRGPGSVLPGAGRGKR
jgi:hypothetical protein